MILKTLSVFAIAAVIGTAAASPLRAQRPPANQNQAGKAQAPAKSNPPQNQQASRPKPWWMDDNSKKELGLTAAQVKAIDDIYTSTKDEMATNRENMDRERKELDRMIAEAKVEQWQVLRQIGRMETARSNYNTAFLMMLYRMNRQLTVEQRTKLQDMERRAREGRGGRGGERHDPKPAR
jgi:Spy/CpxP family protein refolding chaperone